MIQPMYTVYCLAERIHGWHVRYIGITKQRLSTRLHGHMWDAKRPYRREHKSNWIRQCISRAVPIHIRALHSNLKLEDACDIERSLIARYKSNLVNVHEGGTSGYTGLPHDAKLRHAANTKQALEKVYARHRGKVAFYAKICAAAREARERKRMALVRETREVGCIELRGIMFGGVHTIRCYDAGDESCLWITIDGQAHRPRTWRGVMRMVCKRIERSVNRKI